jgi:ubiquinone/menaquinone biosynthesis C-methylase UbiE
MNDFIKDAWDNQADKYRESHWASWGDSYAISLEIDNIAKHIKTGDIVLDVGCANGYSTFEQLKRNKIRIYGIDFSERMINYANTGKNESQFGDQIDFNVGDIRSINFEDDFFDLTYTTRVLINLPHWEDQLKGISECLRVTKKGGKVILSEAFWEPLILLNSLRSLKNLPLLIEHDFNRYLKKDKLEKFLKDSSLRYEINDFSSIYYLGSRFLRELVTKVEDYPGYTNPINEVFYNIEKEYSGGGFGIQQAYIIYK